MRDHGGVYTLRLWTLRVWSVGPLTWVVVNYSPGDLHSRGRHFGQRESRAIDFGSGQPLSSLWGSPILDLVLGVYTLSVQSLWPPVLDLVKQSPGDLDSGGLHFGALESRADLINHSPLGLHFVGK